ncbi:unnamed protein product [Gulo gulo]|uniref:40S ribosomal protein S15a n=1 Tax=Gulo gulo TaxID=48420 RepID=A0A9X9PUS1_GULGU|nr:unnamed protein product [Gulo gulo]
MRSCSKVTLQIPAVMMKHGYMDKFETTDDRRAGKIVVNIIDRLNKCGMISPRFDVRQKILEKWQNNLFLSHYFGFSLQKYTGGKILGFFF